MMDNRKDCVPIITTLLYHAPSKKTRGKWIKKRGKCKGGATDKDGFSRLGKQRADGTAAETALEESAPVDGETGLRPVRERSRAQLQWRPCLPPKMAVPMRTMVAPSAIASRKSPLMPMESSGSDMPNSRSSASRCVRSDANTR